MPRFPLIDKRQEIGEIPILHEEEEEVHHLTTLLEEEEEVHHHVKVEDEEQDHHAKRLVILRLVELEVLPEVPQTQDNLTKLVGHLDQPTPLPHSEE